MILTTEQAAAMLAAMRAMAQVNGDAICTIGDTLTDAARGFHYVNGEIKVIRVQNYKVVRAEAYASHDEFCAAYGV